MSASYTLSDMAADSVGLLDALGLDSAHVVGASMVVRAAREYPRRMHQLRLVIAIAISPAIVGTGCGHREPADPPARGAGRPDPVPAKPLKPAEQPGSATGSAGNSEGEAAAFVQTARDALVGHRAPAVT